jgi:hypothetical protein
MGQFYIGSLPLWAWVYSVSDRQDAIKANELRSALILILSAGYALGY